MRTVNTQIFRSIEVVRDTFISKFDSLLEKRKKEYKNLNDNYKSGSPLYDQERSRLKELYAGKFEEIKKEALAFITKEFLKEKNSIQKELEVFPDQMTIDELRYLDSIPLSETEIMYLHEKMRSNYWVEKSFYEIAKKNDVEIDIITPDVETRINVLNELEERVDQFVNTFTGSKDYGYKERLLLSNSNLFRLENEYTHAFASASYSDIQKAKNKINEALTMSDVLRQGSILSKAYEEMKEGSLSSNIFLYELDNSRMRVSSLEASGLNKVLEKFRISKEYEEIKNAYKVIDYLYDTESKEIDFHELGKEIEKNHGFTKTLEALLIDYQGKNKKTVEKTIEIMLKTIK